MSAAIGPQGPRLFSTHGVTVEEGIAVKRFRLHVSGDERRLYGDEPRREWRALKLLACYAPGLALRPIRADLDADPPRGDRVTELADFVEHITVWAHAGIDAEAFLERFGLGPAERRQISQLRRLFASFWVMRLLPGGSAYHRNPPGTFERQASRLLDLLGSTV